MEASAPVIFQNFLEVSVSPVEKELVPGGVVSVTEEENFL